MSGVGAARLAAPRRRPAEHLGRGIALRVGAVTAFATMMALLKLAANHGASPVELLFYRNLFAFPTIVGWVCLAGGLAAVRTRRAGAHASRSALGLAAMCCTFVALSMLPLAQATAISFAAPLFATILSALALGERVMWHRWAAIASGFLGVLIVVRPGGSGLPALGAAIGLVAALGAAAVIITLRRLGETESATATVFWFNIACLGATALPMPFFMRNHMPLVWLVMALGGVIGGIAQIMMTASVRYAPVSVLAPFDYLQLLWATVWGYVLFAAMPTINGLAGSALIACAGGYVVWRERRTRKAIVLSSNEL